MHPAVYQYNFLANNGFIESDPWMAATQKAKDIATQRRVIVTYLDVLCCKLSLTAAIDSYLNGIVNHTATSAIVVAHASTNYPKKGTLRLWHKLFHEGGTNALLPKYSGTSRDIYGWEARALELYHTTSKPSISKVARDLLRKHGFRNVSDHNVRYFFSTLPADLQDKSPWRMGRKQYNDSLREHIKRTTENLPVGALFQGDGHQIDVYLKHPENGSLWRPELTVWIDVRSRYVVGWSISDKESSYSTMASLSKAMGTYNHVPCLLHIDNGSGFKSKMMNSDTAGFYKNFGIEVIFAIPGNAKAKNIERWFRTMEDDFGKDWDTYCGYDQSPDVSRHFSLKKLTKLDREGKIHWPTLEEWVAGFVDWLNHYHNRPHPECPETTPAAMWATLENTPVEDINLLVKPRKEVTVKRSIITMDNRKYACEFLEQFENKTLIAEYDLVDDSTIRLFDADGRWLTTAFLKSRKDYINPSRHEDAKALSLKEAQKRLANKNLQLEQRAGLSGSLHIQQAEQLSALEQTANDLLASQQPQNDDFDINAVMDAVMRKPAQPKPSITEYDFVMPDFGVKK